MELDLFTRAKIQAFMNGINAQNISGIRDLCPCIRSLMVTLGLLPAILN